MDLNLLKTTAINVLEDSHSLYQIDDSEQPPGVQITFRKPGSSDYVSLYMGSGEAFYLDLNHEFTLVDFEYDEQQQVEMARTQTRRGLAYLDGECALQQVRGRGRNLNRLVFPDGMAVTDETPLLSRLRAWLRGDGPS